MRTFNIVLSTLVLTFLGIQACKKSTAGDLNPNPGQKPEVTPELPAIKSWLVDKNTSDETAWLFYNLKKLSKTNILFGQQDATKRGIVDASTSWANEEHLPSVSKERSDVRDITGSYPVVYGHDFNYIAGWSEGGWFDYERKIARELTIEAYNRGGINTYSWHYSNPVSKGSFYWKESPVEAVSQILPGGSSHDTYKTSLKQIADYAKTLIGADGKLVPIIFRPFHEMDGDWFWWGKGHCTREQYKQLFQFTVNYLRDELQVHNFLYCWSPGGEYTNQDQYLTYYPGDEYVDILGTDNYGFNNSTSIAAIASKLKIISDYAKQKNKIAALTETGQQNLSITDWYTRILLAGLQAQRIEMAYILVWANTKDAYWTPYKNHPAESDFIQFKDNSYVIFANELKQKIYQQNQ